MILTGSEIEREWRNGRIIIDPFIPEQVNPNSYNFRLGRTLRVYRKMPLDARFSNECDVIEIPDEGYVLEPDCLYLAHTMEVLGSRHYAPTFAARSSVARLGLFINLSAALGDIGYTGHWTLQLYTMHPIRVYPGINIGQMMWWRTKGEVVLYDGKYQKAVGPRASDIHVDFDRHFARQRFPGLGASVDAGQVGSKFAELVRCHPYVMVPPAFCVPVSEFAGSLTDEHRSLLADAFLEMRATVGAYSTESMDKIQKVGREIRLTERARTLLAERLKDIGDAGAAIRPSGVEQDAHASRSAGTYRTTLGARGIDEVVAAVEQCWNSYYEAPAITARLRAGDFDPSPRLAVIVQAMVRPEVSGTAFTAGDQLTVEYVKGDAGGEPIGSATSATAEGVLARVTDLVRGLRARLERDVEVTWAADDHAVQVLRIRPPAAGRDVPRSSEEPVLLAFRINFDTLPSSFHLGEIASVYRRYLAKRRPAYLLAAEMGISVGAAWVVQFNGRGLKAAASAPALREVLSGASDESILDFGETLRRVIVPKEAVAERLTQVTGAEVDPGALHAAVVRDFVRGEVGVLSRKVGDRLVVEYAVEGLMALNRGVADSESIVVEDLRRGLDAPGNVLASPGAGALAAHLPDISRFATAMHDRYGPAVLEWVFEDGRLYFLDYSADNGRDAFHATGRGLLVSPGTAEGPLLRLDDDELLRQLTIGPAAHAGDSRGIGDHEAVAGILDRIRSSDRRPVVYASYPYMALSALLGHVAGFVFGRGGTLGRLAIMLRAAGVPAAVAAVRVDDGAEAIISDGAVTVTGDRD